MNIVIVEDETAAAAHLEFLIKQIRPEVQVVQQLDAVKTAVDYFSTAQDVDLVFMDIHLSDGISFQIFEQVEIRTPVIFTTAYDQYALQAFKVNSIDYLLKPMNEEELLQAFIQFESSHQQKEAPSTQMDGILKMMQQFKKPYKQNYLVQYRDELIPVSVKEIAYFFMDTGSVKAMTHKNKAYVVDYKLEELEEQLDPELFYRANRQCIIKKESVVNLKQYFNGKLIVNVNPPPSEKIVVSKAKATPFKKWLNS